MYSKLRVRKIMRNQNWVSGKLHVNEIVVNKEQNSTGMEKEMAKNADNANSGSNCRNSYEDSYENSYEQNSSKNKSSNKATNSNGQNKSGQNSTGSNVSK